MQSTTTELAGEAATKRISSTMSAPEITALLSQHQCRDITDQLDLDKCGHAPILGGGSGDIYHGVLIGGEQVAIKCARLHLRQDAANGHKVLKHIARELYTWSRLKHEHVLALLGLAQFRDQIAMVSPWMKSGTLLEYIERNPDTDRYRLCIGISEGVTYLHQNDVIHGDIKSGNVLISDEGVAKLADFGCTELKTVMLNFTTTSSTSMFSTRWAAPEILEGSVEQSMMADVYALGMTLLEVLTGAIPFPDKQDMAVYHIVALKKQIPNRPDEFPSFDENEANELWGIMAKSWAYEPPRRPTATAIRDLEDDDAGPETEADFPPTPVGDAAPTPKLTISTGIASDPVPSPVLSPSPVRSGPFPPPTIPESRTSPVVRSASSPFLSLPVTPKPEAKLTLASLVSSTSAYNSGTSTPILLKYGRPLKPSLKSGVSLSMSTPDVPSVLAQAKSAPSTPRVHFPTHERLESVIHFEKHARPLEVASHLLQQWISQSTRGS